MSSNTGQVAAVNISVQKGTSKQPVGQAVVDERGLQGDAHAGTPGRLVSLLSEELIAAFAQEHGRTIGPGEFAENITTRGLDLQQLAPLDTLAVGNVLLEVTQIGKACHGDNCAIYRELGRCVMPKEGIFCRVLQGGTLRAAMEIVHRPRPLRFRIITISDRASRGEYEDRSGPRLHELIEQWAQDKRWHIQINSALVPDDPSLLANAVRAAREAACDVVLTTGGTGIGPRDITPEVVIMECSKLIPGVMERIRLKCSERNPQALLSRSIAGVLGHGVIYTLPGSVRAVEEYMAEITSTLEHTILMLHAVDAH